MPSTLPSKRPGGQERQQAGDPDRELLLGPVQGADREDRERRRLLGVVERLGGRHLHRLLLGHDLALDVAGHGDADAGHDHHPGADPDCRARTSAGRRRRSSDARAATARRQRRTHHRSGTPPVTVCGNVTSWVELVSTAHEVVELGAAGLRVEVVADRVLHPRVRGQDEVRRQHRADVHDPDAGDVEPRGAACPSRRSTAPGTSTRGRTRAAPRSPAAHRRCRRRTASSRSSSCRTGTPGRSR